MGSRWVLTAAAALAGLLASFALIPPGFLPPSLRFLEPFLPLMLLDLSVPLFLAARAGSIRDAFRYGWAAGFGWLFSSLAWISHSFTAAEGPHTPFNAVLVPFVLIVAPLAIGLFWGAGFALAVRLARAPQARLLLLIAAIALAEYVRGFIFTGLPLGAPGMVALNIWGGLGAASVFGLWGLSLIAVAGAAIPAALLMRQRGMACLGLGMVAAALLLGFIFAPRMAGDDSATLTARLVQPAIAQRDKWQSAAQREANLRVLLQLTRAPAEAGGEPPDLIIWPETAFEGRLDRDAAYLAQLTRAALHNTGGARRGLLMGLLREDSGGVYNSAALFDTGGNAKAVYDKRHLVPFGEYTPLRRYLPFIDIFAGPSSFTPGVRDDVMTMPLRGVGGDNITLLPLICYEAIFPSQVRRAVNTRRPDILVVLTNDAWFGDGIGPHQQLAHAQLRSAELGLPMLRVSNSGISAGVDSRGRITTRMEHGVRGFADIAVAAHTGGRTLYARFGDWIFLLLLGVMVIGGFIIGRRDLNSDSGLADNS